MSARKALQLIDRIEGYAYDAINETGYAFSYEVGSRRYDQARVRASTAESKMANAIADLRKLLEAAP